MILPSPKRKGRLFLHNQPDDHTLTVYQAIRVKEESALTRRQGSDDYVAVGLEAPCILVAKSSDREVLQRWKVRQRWNDKTLSCDLMDEDNGRYSVSEISCKVLGDFLFSGPDWR